MQVMLGSVLTTGYAAKFASLIASSPDSEKVWQDPGRTASSFSSAANTAEQYPQYAEQDHRRRESPSCR